MLAGTAMVVSSVFGLERNSRSFHPLQGRLGYLANGTTRGFFRRGLFSEGPVGKSKDCALSMPCTSCARVS